MSDSDPGDHKWEWRSIAIALAGAVISFGVSYLLPAGVKADAIFSLIFAALLFIISKQYERLANFRRIERSLGNIDTSHRSLIEFSKSNQRIAEKIIRILSFDATMQATAFHALEQSLAGISVRNRDNYIVVKGQEMCFHSYVFFWKAILDIQRGNSQTMVARLTHASEIEAWKGDASRQLRDMQDIHHDFIHRGGYVFRLFIANSKTGKLEHYLEAMSEMQSVGIKCAFIHDDNSLSIDRSDFNRDFCIIDDFEYSSDWQIDADMRVRSCEIGKRPIRYQDNLRKWNRYVKALEKCDYEKQPGLSPSELGILKAARAEFLAALPVS